MRRRERTIFPAFRQVWLPILARQGWMRVLALLGRASTMACGIDLYWRRFRLRAAKHERHSVASSTVPAHLPCADSRQRPDDRVSIKVISAPTPAASNIDCIGFCRI